MARKYVYFFGEGKAEGKSEMKNLLGGKGADLAEMTNLGIRVPAGFTISTEVCTAYYENNGKFPEGLKEEVEENLKKVEKAMGAKFGDTENPLLVSVRSGARVSMPGMMDTVLNIGLNDKTVEGLIRETKNPRLAYDSYRRFVQMYGNVVLGLDKDIFESILERKKEEIGIKFDTELSVEGLKSLVEEFKKAAKKYTGKNFPEVPYEQLWGAIAAVFGSWNTKRAISYRKINNIPDDWGTAANVQAMVFGNMGEDSATGVAFTRDPSTGENVFYGEYLVNAQGEDVVAGIRTPHPLNKAQRKNNPLISLEEEMPQIYEQLENIRGILERHYRDIQDIEFTIQKGKLWMLQTRTGKRTAQSAIKVAVDMQEEGLIDKKTAVHRVDPMQLDQLLHRRFDPKAKKEVVAQGLAASPGAATGKVVFTADEAEQLGQKGEKVILVRTETSPEDIHGMVQAQGILTSRGGMTCISGDSIILTDKGFFKAKEIFKKLENNEKLNILSYDSGVFEPKWKKIIAAGRRKSKVIKIATSQSGRTKHNFLKITPDHKMYTFQNRELTKLRLDKILEEEGHICLIDKIPQLQSKKTMNNEKLAYLVGAILTEKRPAEILDQIRENLVLWVLNLDEISCLNFLAGAIDGDGTFYSNRIMIFVSKENLAQAIVVATLKLGIVPEVTVNRNVYNIQILEKLDKILSLTKRVKGDLRQRMYGTKLFSVRGLFSDIVEEVNFMGRPKECIKRNLLMDAEKIKRDILPICSSNPVRPELERVLNSNLRMYRVKEIEEKQEEYVYNFEVEANDDLNKNYVVFTEMYTPLLVSNSHAAVVARGMGKCCVAGCESIRINYGKKEFSVNGKVVKRGDYISIDGATGEVMIGEVPTVDSEITQVIKGKLEPVKSELYKEYSKLMKWVDEIRKIGVRTNADTPSDAKLARDFGAEGIGLARTEHMFFGEERLPLMQEMILADTENERKKAADKLLPLQKQDFKGILKAMDGLPVIIRLLDPPLHEFLPKHEDLLIELTHLKATSGNEDRIKELERILAKVNALKELNPMLGHRGCRLGITFPEVYRMQNRAIFEAACELVKEGFNPIPEVMIPLVSHINEFKITKKDVEEIAKSTIKEFGVELRYMVGTMIELPRAALTADEIAKEAEFFSYGTNDLTQMTFGFSRDDIEGKFLPVYIDKNVLENNPFAVLDKEGVGQLIKIGIEKGRKTKPDLEVGICGEHGGEPSSVKFCHQVGMNYVSCSPYRVPIARLAAAHAALEE